jgi:hypothetical protein
MGCRSSHHMGERIRQFRNGLLAVAAALLGACSTGGPGAGINEIDRAFLSSIVSWDMNKDGTVTCDEWKAYARAAFMEADANRDGKLTPAEFETLAKGDRLFFYANFAYYDTNRDGFVDTKEFIERPNPAFTYIDTDKNCALTPEEISRTRALTQAPPETASSGKGDDAKVPGSK